MDSVDKETHLNEVTKPQESGVPSHPLKAPEVYFYQDYRVFLQEWLNWKKATISSYSGQLFARKAGLQSHTILGMVIRGQRNLTPPTIRAFAKAISLSGKAYQYFESLVLFNQSKNHEDKAYYFSRLLDYANKVEIVAVKKINNHARYLKSWYIPAVRQLVNLSDFIPDAEWISEKLKKFISTKEAEDAWKTICELGLVKWSEEKKRFELVDPIIDFAPGTVDFAVRAYHKSYLERSTQAIDRESLEERELSSLTMAVRREQISVLREELNEIRRILNQKYNASIGTASDVVAINMQFLVLSGHEKIDTNKNKNMKDESDESK